ncbi:aminotransferase class I/II-fold pyridoxal phosphate-dependent enzyme [Candidatus Gottesmanbacteria bacterium]|nr:aminotransferase class I/II-fold pyridoxal phosphate-dependent enzyme [Candidatus Gottesmanbacteria bacterium]
MKPNSFWQHAIARKPATYIPDHNVSVRHNFAALENDFGVSPAVTKALKTIHKLPLNHYPDRNAEALRTKIAHWLELTPDMIVLGNGSDELISLIAEVFVEPGSSVVVQTATFFRIIEAVQKMKGVITAVAAQKDRRFALDMQFADEIIRVARKSHATVVWLCTPNNPTGVVMDLSLIDRIAGSTKALVVVDEAYQELWDPQNKKSAVTLLAKHENLIVTKTFSKAFGLAAIRVGMMLGNPDLISAIDAWRLNFPLSSVSLRIAEAALDDTNHLVRIHRNVLREREFLFSHIAKLPMLELGAVSKTNVFLLRHKTKNLHELLLKQGVMTADFNHMNGVERMRFVRITVKRRKENRALIQALVACAEEGKTV